MGVFNRLLVTTGRTACGAALSILFLPRGWFSPSRATRCTNNGEISQGRADLSSLPNFILVGSEINGLNVVILCILSLFLLAVFIVSL